ncbi:4-hydroxy-3-methylbut-2-enyl diphosphate reductase [bacterium]|jgi:4-hydroxy-3-methylbut-2-en-1-yl diphosphate reductase|nr:4-hydroxy-3-methylbut-2-enyl diphosphate reductase [bacterium]MDA7511025.1 4-hydroxy-3-methylbut-2-enyl diphosphate reductase [Verrucomicrobiota bacterium]MDA7680675.1 4-hydroxy-3-methylbut-2-enyl diphosphate reductase [bacterium]MDB4798184.1 4-hydroxy-3-methylbut-2-enyl diphosphate reductase [Verrucomicrobiota bacterium]
MKIHLASHLGMCFGVRDAIKLAQEKATNEPLTVLGDLVHNQGVLSALSKKGIESNPNLAEAKTQSIMITAHGTSNRMRKHLKQRGFTVHDASCPLVHHAHRELEKLVSAGYFPIIIGLEGHIEVKGLTGDLENYRVILSEKEVDTLPKQNRYGIVAQTTQPIQHVQYLVERIERRFPDSEVIFKDTVCQPTKNRQRAALELAQKSDVVIVIGGAHSNNTHELVKVCATECHRVYHVQSAAALKQVWFRPTDHIGITAGTSTPDNQIQEVVRQLEIWAMAPLGSIRENQSHQPLSIR